MYITYSLNFKLILRTVSVQIVSETVNFPLFYSFCPIKNAKKKNDQIKTKSVCKFYEVCTAARHYYDCSTLSTFNNSPT